MKPNFGPHHCAEDGGNCTHLSGGYIYYGRKWSFDDPKRPADMMDVLVDHFTVVPVNQSSTVECDPKVFEGIDPLPD